MVGDLAGVTGARIATLAFGLLTVVLTARVLSPTGYAVITYITLGATLVMFVAAGWSGAAVMRYGREELDREAGMRRTAWARFVLTVPILIVVCAGLVALKAAGALPQEFEWRYVSLTIVLGILLVLGEQIQVVLDASGRMRLSAAAAAGRQAVIVVGLLVIVLAGTGQSIVAVAWLTVAAAALLVIGLGCALRGLSLWPPQLDCVQLRRIIIFSLPLVIFAASQYGMRSVDIIVLRAYRSPADVGVYALAYQSYTMLQTLAVTLTVVLIPLFVSLRDAGRTELIKRYFNRLVPQAMLASAALGGLLAPLAVFLVPLLFGPDFAEAARPLALLVCALVLFAVTSLFAPIIMLYERTREASLINAAALAVNIVGDVVLIGVLDAGVIGPAIATIAALAVIVVGYLCVAQRDLCLRLPLSPLLALPLAAGILPSVLLPPSTGVALGMLGACAATGYALWRLPLFEAEDAQLVARLDLPSAIRDRAVATINRLAR